MKTKSSVEPDEVVPQAVLTPKPLAKSKSASPKLTVKKTEAVQKADTVEKSTKVEKVQKATKKAKLKVVRDSFTMPQNEYLKIATIKEMCLEAGFQVKKSEVLRAGLIALCALDQIQLTAALSGLEKIKTGRPNKH